MSPRQSLALVITLLTSLTMSALAPLDAHARPRSPVERLGTDSVAWQRVLVYVVSAMSVDLVRTSPDSSAQPWSLQLPAGEPQRSLLDAQLRTILRARWVTTVLVPREPQLRFWGAAFSRSTLAGDRVSCPHT